MYAHYADLYSTQKFGFAGAAQRNPKLVKITVLTSTLDIRVKCASASFPDAERNITLHAEQDCMIVLCSDVRL